MRNIFLLIFSLSAFLAEAQKEKNEYSNIRFKIKYETEKGLLDGTYSSYYANGVLRANGNFYKNTRIGVWTVYDSVGRKIFSRNYSGHLSYQELLPAKLDGGAASLLDTSFYVPKYNADGYIEYSKLAERMVIFDIRLWRELNKKNNAVLFKDNLLFKSLYNYAIDSSKKSYCSIKDIFDKKMTYKEIEKFSDKYYSVVSFKIKEDTFFDVDRLTMDTRIIGICPVGIDKNTKDTVEMFWVYYPYVRQELSMQKLKDKTLSTQVKTVEDIFFFRNFNGEILKQSMVSDKSLKEYCKTDSDLKEERQRIEISLIEFEHEFWLGNIPH